MSTPLSERALRRGMNVNILAGALGMMWVAVAMGIPLTMFMESLQASGVLIGLTVTVQQIAMVLQIPAAMLTDRLTVRKRFWATVAIVQRMLWFIPAFLPFFLADRLHTAGIAMVAIVSVSAALANAVAAPWWSWMADLIPEHVRGQFWGRRQSLVTAAHLFALWVAGYLLDLFPDPSGGGGSFLGFSLVFALGAALGTADIVVHLWVPEPPPVLPERTTPAFKRLLAPLANRDFRQTTLAMGMWMLGVGLIGQFGYVYLKRTYDVTYTQLSVTTMSASAGVIVAGVLWGYIMDRLGPRNLAAISMILAPCFGAVWFFMRDAPVLVDLPLLPAFSVPQPILLLCCVNVAAGAFYSAVALARVGLATSFASPEGRTAAMAVHWSIVGLLGAFGPLAGGRIMDWMTAHPVDWVFPTGTHFGFFHVLVVLQMTVSWCVAVPLVLRIRRRPGEVPVRTAFSRLIVGNPLRALSSIYSIYAMGSAATSQRRANAVRTVGSRRAALAVSDLIERMDDPAAEVREEAALALGRVGCPEAVDALLRKFNDPTSDVMPQIARALREAKSPESVGTLIEKLSDSDRETVAETARALGAIGDRRASKALMQLLERSADPKVVSAAGEALSLLGEMAAIYEMLPRMINTQNPVLRQSLAVAIGDLAGKPNEFYRILTREQKSHGSAVDPLLTRVRDAIRAATRTAMHEEGEHLTESLKQIQTAYDTRDFDATARLISELSLAMAALHYGIEFGDHTDVVSETMIWHDERFGIGIWYLNMLQERMQTAPHNGPDKTEVLLGLYFLSIWSGGKSKTSADIRSNGE